ncbi:MAG: zinc ABC transporter substrate-binding protein [Chitinophagaceae bacterium]|nr:zinc ABC transporter substrate-binding protein [Oligoflexus sp.]
MKKFNIGLRALIPFVCVMWSMPSFAKLRVVTTLPSYADIAANVGGDEVDASSLTKGTQDPHFVDAKPDLILKLNRADLLIRAGLGLEDGWLPPLLTGSRNGKIQTGGEGYLDASSLMSLKEIPKGVIDRSQGDVHPGGNPHFMIDPRNGAILAKAVASKLGVLVPAKAEYFQKRADAYIKDLAIKTDAWKKILAPLKGRQVVTYHKSWVYFSDWVGLDEVGYVEPKPGIPPSPDHIAKLVILMKEKHVKLILMEPYYPKGAAEQLAKLTGATLLVLPTEVQGDDDAKTYFGLFDSLTSKLARGMVP